MNRYVYLVHLAYRDHGQPAAALPGMGLQALSDGLARLQGHLRSRFPGSHVRIHEEPSRCDPDVVCVTVVTMLDEATADGAFVRFIRDCHRALSGQCAGAHERPAAAAHAAWF